MTDGRIKRAVRDVAFPTRASDARRGTERHVAESPNGGGEKWGDENNYYAS